MHESGRAGVLSQTRWVAQGQMDFVHDKQSMVDVVAGL